MAVTPWGPKIQFAIRYLLGCSVLLASGCGWADTVATPVLQCQIVQSGKIFDVESGLTQDPYLAPLHDINGRFLFKMVVVGSAQSIDYVKIYAYDNSGRQPVLVQYGRYVQPIVSGVSPVVPLTGIQTVYSAWLEREMQYQCTLLRSAP